MRKRILSFILAALMLTALIPSAFAATLEDINQPSVFLKQSQRGTCTLVSSAMMLRRTAMMRGDADWAEITEASCRSAFWLSGRGLPYHFTYKDITVDNVRLPGGNANKQVLIDTLAEHPEGVVLHASSVPHGILLTDYTDGVFYCADPAQGIPSGRIPVTQAYGTRVENSSSYWYASSPSVKLEEPQPEEPEQTEPEAQDQSPMSMLVSQGLQSAKISASTLILQAMAQAGDR